LEPSLSNYHPKEDPFKKLRLEKPEAAAILEESPVVKNTNISSEYSSELSKLAVNTITTLCGCSKKEIIEKVFELVGYCNFSVLQKTIFLHNFSDGKYSMNV